MFIRKRNYNRPLASILLALFLFTTVLSQASSLLSSCLKAYGIVITKTKGNTPSNLQFPFEKSEKGEKPSEGKMFFLSHFLECLLFEIAAASEIAHCTLLQSPGDTAHIPLYLFVRALLI